MSLNNPYLSNTEVIVGGLQTPVDMSQKNIDYSNYGAGPEQLFFKPVQTQSFKPLDNNFGTPAAHAAMQARGAQTQTHTQKSKSVICTELKSQGKLPEDEASVEVELAKTLPKEVLRGYHIWAVPYVKLMRKSELATKIIKKLFDYRHQEVMYKMGKAEKGSVIGKLLRLTGEPICYILGYGAKLLKLSEEKWKELYKGESK